MNPLSALDALVEALAAVPATENPLTPIYEALGRQRPLTVRAVHAHSRLLHDHADQARAQIAAINSLIVSCQQIPPTPCPDLPSGF